MFDVKILAENIRKYRLEAGLRQFELADRLGVSPQAVSKWEQANAVPDVGNLCTLSDLYGVTLDKLVLRKYVEKIFMIAVDGGGTKTEFVLFSNEGNIKNRLVLDGCNPNVVGIEKTYKILKTGIDNLRSDDVDVLGIYCGIAGAFSGNNKMLIDNFLHKTYPNVITECSSDIRNVAASVIEEEKCITVICGTGSNVSIINGKDIKRIGGWGYLFDGKGSGFDIGRDAISAVLAYEDGIGDKTMLTSLITQRLGGSVWDNINYIYSQDKGFVASFTKEVFKAYREGDRTAIDIIESNITALADKINFAVKNYDCGNKLIISGGLINQKDILMEIFEKKLEGNLKMIFPTLPQIFGASKLCIRKCKVDSNNFTENFTRDYAQYMEE